MDLDRAQIETSRLVLRPHRQDDFEDSLRMWQDSAVVRLIRENPFTEEETWARVLRYTGHWQFMGFGYWVVRRRDDQRFMGEIGFAFTKRNLPAPFLGLPEFSCTFVRAAWGSAIAYEAASAAIGWMSEVANRKATVAITDKNNRSALALASRLGYAQRSLVDFEGRPFIVLARGLDPSDDGVEPRAGQSSGDWAERP